MKLSAMEDGLDVAIKALSAPERREVLGALLDSEETHVPGGDREKVISLAHNHLPRLANGGFVEYHHTDEGVWVARGDNFEDLRPLIEFVLEDFDLQ